MRNPFKRKQKIVLTGRVIDMTRPTWGWNISGLTGPDDNGVWRSAIWCTPRPKVGDELVWLTGATGEKRGEVKSLITAVEYCRDPNDMAFIDGRITHLNGEPV